MNTIKKRISAKLKQTWKRITTLCASLKQKQLMINFKAIYSALENYNSKSLSPKKFIQKINKFSRT